VDDSTADVDDVATSLPDADNLPDDTDNQDEE
jgi:hypothetical protein